MTGNGGFDDAASAVVASAPEPEVEREGAPSQKFLIEDEWATGAVKAVFGPLSEYDHPAWALTDAEAEKVRPKMQAFMQAVCDRYFPALLIQFSLKHRELFNLLMALSTVAWVKARVVAKEKARLQEAVAESSVSTSDSESEKVRCDACLKDFVNVEAAAAHLPCPGPAQ